MFSLAHLLNFFHAISFYLSPDLPNLEVDGGTYTCDTWAQKVGLTAASNCSTEKGMINMWATRYGCCGPEKQSACYEGAQKVQDVEAVEDENWEAAGGYAAQASLLGGILFAVMSMMIC